MRKRHVLLIILLLSVGFNLSVFFMVTSSRPAHVWVFPELGPAVIQDSYYVRSPGLETPFGMIGDVPGGYSLYSGIPLQDTQSNGSMVQGVDLGLRIVQPELSVDYSSIFLSIVFAVVPLTVVALLGRRSYGS